MINGIINVYKEKGFTSFDVVAKMRGIMHQKKIGHTGTLDPEAEGVLPVCLGKATKVCDLLTDKSKVYEAVLLLGRVTDTQDTTGKILESHEAALSAEDVCSAIQSFIGEYDQIPPMYSALKVNGRKLYDLAREGITVERQPRRVMIHDIEILSVDLPEVTMRVFCSKGTYIRTLCHDIGQKLGCGGCMKSLLRTRVSEFVLEDAWKLSEIAEWMDAHPDAGTEEIPFLRTIDSVFRELPECRASEEADKYLVNGNKIPCQLMKGPQEFCRDLSYRLYSHTGIFAGIYCYRPEEDCLKPVKVFMEH